MSRKPTGGVVADPLFVGITRPAMALGVPYAALLTNAFVVLELFLISRNLLSLVLALPLHAFSWLLCLAEPRFFELVAVWARLRIASGGVRDRRWKAVSYSQFNTRSALIDTDPPIAVVTSGNSQ